MQCLLNSSARLHVHDWPHPQAPTHFSRLHTHLVLEPKVQAGRHVQARSQQNKLDWEDAQLALVALAGVAFHAHDVATLHLVVELQEGLLIQLRCTADKRGACTGGRGRV